MSSITSVPPQPIHRRGRLVEVGRSTQSLALRAVLEPKARDSTWLGMAGQVIIYDWTPEHQYHAIYRFMQLRFICYRSLATADLQSWCCLGGWVWARGTGASKLRPEQTLITAVPLYI